MRCQNKFSNWLACASVVLCLSVEAKRQPVLIYNQMPHVWKMDFKEMKNYLETIKHLGFNVVWVNPFFKTSDFVVKRTNKTSGDFIRVKGSLYATDTFFKYEGSNTIDDIKSYTDEATNNELVPIFDLVLNHVAKYGEFQQNNQDWFKKDSVYDDAKDSVYDDVAVFSYDVHRDNICETHWKGTIEYLMDLGFKGCRIDYCHKIDEKALKKCVEYVRSKNYNALILGETMLGINEHGINENFVDFKDKIKSINPTNLTNHVINLTAGDIKKGKVEGYHWFLHDLGHKRNTTASNSAWWNGTIGFPGSHDDGTAIQVGIKHDINNELIDAEMKKITEYPEIKAWVDQFDKSKKNEKLKEIAKGRLIQKKVWELTEDKKISLAKERIAIAALSSDAGWCLMAGDEIMSTITKRSFVREDGGPFGGSYDNMSKVDLNDPVPSFIRMINKLFKENLRESENVFWVEIFYLPSGSNEKAGMYFVRHIIFSDTKTADIIVVELDKEFKAPNNEELKKHLNKYSQINKIEGFDKSNVKLYHITEKAAKAVNFYL